MQFSLARIMMAEKSRRSNSRIPSVITKIPVLAKAQNMQFSLALIIMTENLVGATPAELLSSQRKRTKIRAEKQNPPRPLASGRLEYFI